MIKECSPICKHMNKPIVVQHLNILQTRSLILFISLINPKCFDKKTAAALMINDT